ncbi:penicillin-binding protein activator [Pseudosulfitobacter pseudonitzschiae]|uniref:ABC transporter substrate-binding protein n=1 Tax=Pseudosulfitobacter pseudonitzschiae TaxID=1402135 RepID=A0A073J110_9RHOB|nr:penicillin-binding protein activator [Pseudosulfitobacter pseudonitzschiae]KEJ95505.1 ABC transporter substrate-binding protein [Pseudosulfitobacter pseudonitzschiae]MBM1816046.1 penicillin-binding protein activator [Pseudosulfitobacter pseudonitzschiae]MBM1833352.1 penicillin-binding protein activator [Pseudosulfitobacter pseudonitzschiae]MBM1838219.1 penicillin-binding protein activator [Pseudosulfitobacter pseudonitzschiae]MBM1842751.1 penicillin-binding protein activator [Pseudosulfitob
MFAFLQPARKALRLLILSLFALALAACDAGMTGGVSRGGPSVDTSKPVPVALLVPRGGSASDNLLANSLENAARLAMRDLSGVAIDLRVYATAGNAATAASVATQAVNDGAKIIIGPVYAEAANAAGVAAASAGVNVLAFSNNTTIAGGNVFVLGPTFQTTANRLVSYAARQGKSRIVVVSAQDVAGQLGRSAIQNAISNSGATLAGSVDYPLSQQGVIDAVPRIKSTVDSSGADAVFMTSSTASALPLLAQLLPEAGIQPTVTQYIGLTRWDIPSPTLSLPGLQGGWFALPDPARSAAFSAKYQAAYGSTPHPIASLGFDGIAAVGALVAKGNSNALTGAALTQGAGFQGASGIFRLRSDGTNDRGLAIATIRNNQVVVIDAAPQSFGGAGF